MTSKYPQRPPKVAKSNETLAERLQEIAKFYRSDKGRRIPVPNLPYGDDAELVELVKVFRKANGLSQTDFANVYGIELRSLQNWERGACTLSSSTRRLLHAILAKPHDMAAIEFDEIDKSALETTRAKPGARASKKAMLEDA